ncbi:LppM family (lipo)protein [Pseudonocardia nigra]|uniref:LppM family (lipo)protein n=1 Tax=Pseudonocardia nigra TaxID=1921578 RepID=UPI0027E27E40|nr:DUF3153 domain-containing protein [Pseudonocardia nigra]
MSAPASTARRVVLPLLALLVAVGVLSGCARVQVALAVQPDDTVTGQIVIATPEKGPDDPGPQVTLPEDLEDEVDVSEYRQDGYAGSLLRFDSLTFEQVAALTQVAGPAGEAVHLEMHRAGDRLVVTGAVDLTTVTVDRADFQLKIAFPGQVVETNGEEDSGEVSWTFDAGAVGDVNAVVAFADPNAPSAVNWSIGLATVVALAAAAVVLLARRTRNPPLSPPSR